MRFLTLIRSMIATFLFPFTVLILGPLMIVLHILFQNKKIDDLIIMTWGRVCCRMSGVRVHISGLDNIPNEACLFLFNHTSFFDVFAMAGYIPGIRFGAKAELFKIPIFGHAIRAIGTLPIARGNRNEVFKVYEEAALRFEGGEKFNLAPEGGRFYGPKLSPFKAGPFVFAMSSKVPVVPTVIFGAYEALPKGAVLFNKNHWKLKIEIHILAPIETKSYTNENRAELQKIVYDKMNDLWVQKFPYIKSKN